MKILHCVDSSPSSRVEMQSEIDLQLNVHIVILLYSCYTPSWSYNGPPGPDWAPLIHVQSHNSFFPILQVVFLSFYFIFQKIKISPICIILKKNCWNCSVYLISVVHYLSRLSCNSSNWNIVCFKSVFVIPSFVLEKLFW